MEGPSFHYSVSLLVSALLPSEKLMTLALLAQLLMPTLAL